MKAIICEMCGGNDILKDQGFFVCQNCGTKYTIEEARKMMIEFSGNVDVSGSSIKIDNTDKLKNYILLAKNAYNARNYIEAENYCNKIIEIDFKHSQAWFMKGMAAGCQSSMSNMRIEEAINSISKAIEFADDSEKQNCINDADKFFQDLLSIIMEDACNIYVDIRSKENADIILDITDKTVKQILLLLNNSKMNSSFENKISKVINSVVEKTWRKMEDKYTVSGHPNQVEWNEFIVGGDTLILLEEYAYKYVDDSGSVKKKINQNIIDIERKIIQSGCYSPYGSGWARTRSLPDTEKRRRQRVIEKISSTINTSSSQITETNISVSNNIEPRKGMDPFYIVLIIVGAVLTHLLLFWFLSS